MIIASLSCTLRRGLAGQKEHPSLLWVLHYTVGDTGAKEPLLRKKVVNLPVCPRRTLTKICTVNTLQGTLAGTINRIDQRELSAESHIHLVRLRSARTVFCATLLCSSNISFTHGVVVHMIPLLLTCLQVIHAPRTAGLTNASHARVRLFPASCARGIHHRCHAPDGKVAWAVVVRSLLHHRRLFACKRSVPVACTRIVACLISDICTTS
mmetsp:Transcript_129913/g.224463  ORF Transcript_129913/g.224463 Transcript_129913/m.224463 type:complete len:210 (-) Transcript_129913:537-1166(-)